MPISTPATTATSSSLSGNGTLRPANLNRTPTFNEHHENTHRIEFEAPLTAHSDLERDRLQKEQGRFSIDLSLELERQLAMESPPVTPGFDATTDTHTRPESISKDSTKDAQSSKELMPDPDILAHIVTQLRQSLVDMTNERDELVKMLATANAQEAYAKDALQLITEKATEAEEELTAARKKMKEDEEQIVLLRAKVEESRRGVMRLQTESRRQSMAPIDVARASSLALSAFGSPPSSKRASFTPLTGSMQGRPNGHRRISSVSDSSFGTFPAPDLTPSPNSHAFNIAAAEASLSGAPNSSRRFSGLFGRQSPPENDLLLSAASAEAANAAEFEALRAELKTIKDELDTVKSDLAEANEAKEASETCVKALREFIAENSIGAMAVKLPTPPTMTTGEETQNSADPRKTSTGWGFKLWGGGSVDSPLRSSVGTAPPFSASPSPVIPSTAMLPPGSATIGAAPLSRKLGGFFSSRSSISSTNSREQQRQHPQQLPHLQTNAAVMQHPSHQRDSIYSYSDTSSVAEPVSPGSDIHGLGAATYASGQGQGQMKVHELGLGPDDVVVRDVTNLNRISEVDSVKGGMPVSVSAGDLNGLR